MATSPSSFWCAEPTFQTLTNRSDAVKVKAHGAVHLHHRRRGLLARQGSRIGGARRAAAGARLQGPAAQARPLSQRRSGHDEPVLSTARSSSPTTAPRPISTSATTSASPAARANKRDNITTGRIYQDIIAKERRGDYLGAHRAGDPARHRRHQGVRPRRQRRTSISCSSRSAARSATSRACRSSRRSASSATTCRAAHAIYIHLTLMPYIPSAGELKTKPTQHSVKRAALDRHPARHPAVPLRPADPDERAAQARAVLQRARERRDPGARRRLDLRRAARLSRRRARPRSAGRLRHRPTRRSPT